MGRRFITARDIEDLLARGEQELHIDGATVLTDLARELARDRGVRVVTVDTPPAVAADAAPDRAGPSRRELRAAVRAAVVAEFGTTPPGIDAAIGRVFDRFDVHD